jgi:nitroreductase
MGRTPEAALDRLFIDRYSPRAFARRPVEAARLDAVFEAARWSMSASNGQPWRFVYATREDQPQDHARFAALLVDANRRWAEAAPVLGFVLADERGARPGERNRWAQFDTGAAYMALTLQAALLGLHTHAMAGLHTDQVYPAVGADPIHHTVLCGFALGYLGDPATLPPDLAAREAARTDRLPRALVVGVGRLPEG